LTLKPQLRFPQALLHQQNGPKTLLELTPPRGGARGCQRKWRIIHNKDIDPFVASQIYEVVVYNFGRQQCSETHPVYTTGIYEAVNDIVNPRIS
jgi:hypothetical protein